MMSLESIVALNEQIAAEAAAEGLVPFVPSNADTVNLYPPFPFPNLGYLHPSGWEKTEANWFIDKTSQGYDWEPALTVRQFKNALKAYVEENPTHGYAITEEGPFQVIVSAFRLLEREDDV